MQVGVAKQALDHREVHSAFDPMGGETVVLVDVAGPQVDRLGQTQPRAVNEHQEGPVVPLRGAADQALDLLHAKHLRQTPAAART